MSSPETLAERLARKYGLGISVGVLAAINDCIEECAKVADEIGDAWNQAADDSREKDLDYLAELASMKASLCGGISNELRRLKGEQG